MEQVVVNSQYKISLPHDLRKKMNIKSGQKFLIDWDETKIQLVPDIELSDLKGFLKGIDTEIIREGDRL